MEKEVKLSDQYKILLRDQEYMLELMRKNKNYTPEDIEEMRKRIDYLKKEIDKAISEEKKGRSK